MTVQTREELETLIDQVVTELINLYDIAEKKRQMIGRARAALKALELGWVLGQTVLYMPNVVGEAPMLFKEIQRSKVEDDEFYALCVCINPDGSERGLAILAPIEVNDNIRVFPNLDAYYEQFPPLTPPESEEKEESSSANEEALNDIEIVYPEEKEFDNGTNQQSGEHSAETSEETSEGAQGSQEGSTGTAEGTDSTEHQG